MHQTHSTLMQRSRESAGRRKLGQRGGCVRGVAHHRRISWTQTRPDIQTSKVEHVYIMCLEIVALGIISMCAVCGLGDCTRKLSCGMQAGVESRGSTALQQAEAFVAAIIFAVHPIHTEAVAGIVGHAELFSAALSILAILLYVQATVRLVRNPCICYCMHTLLLSCINVYL